LSERSALKISFQVSKNGSRRVSGDLLQNRCILGRDSLGWVSPSKPCFIHLHGVGLGGESFNASAKISKRLSSEKCMFN